MITTMYAFLFALVMVYFAFPVVARLETKGFRREFATLFLFALMTLIGASFVFGILPFAVQEILDFAQNLPNYVDRAAPRAIEILNQGAHYFGLSANWQAEELRKMAEELGVQLRKSLSPEQWQGIWEWSMKLIAGGVGLLLGLVNLLLVPVFFYFVIVDFEKMNEFFWSLIPPRYRSFARHFRNNVHRILSGFLFGQSTVALVLALLYGLGLYLVGLDYGLVIGALTGLMSFFPYVGMSIGLFLAGIVSLAHFEGWGQMVLVLLVFGAIQLVDGLYITPRIVGNKVGLRPLEALLSLLIMGNTFGFVGVLVAIPAGGMLKMSFLEFVKFYEKSRFYQRNQ